MQLPPRDVKNIKKAEAKQRDDEERGRRLREEHGVPDNEEEQTRAH